MKRRRKHHHDSPWLGVLPAVVQVPEGGLERLNQEAEAAIAAQAAFVPTININSGDARLVLLCPAWRKWGTARTVKPDTVILHSRADDGVPFADSEDLVKHSGLPPWTLIEVGSDHRLADPEPLAAMLEACETVLHERKVDRSSTTENKARTP